jgi:molybdenum cofactor cytidylyltransferase
MQGLLLAAGRSVRFGTDKLLQPLPDGTPLAVAAARNLAAALPGALAVVNGADRRLMEALELAGLRVSVCPRAHEGMGRSLAWGVAQTPTADGWLIALADMPWIDPTILHAVAAGVTGPMAIAAPVHAGRRGHPVAFGRGHGAALAALSGDVGARELLRVHGGDLNLVPCAAAGVLWDVDCPADLASGTFGPAAVDNAPMPVADVWQTIRARMPPP